MIIAFGFLIRYSNISISRGWIVKFFQPCTHLTWARGWFIEISWLNSDCVQQNSANDYYDKIAIPRPRPPSIKPRVEVSLAQFIGDQSSPGLVSAPNPQDGGSCAAAALAWGHQKEHDTECSALPQCVVLHWCWCCSCVVTSRGSLGFPVSFVSIFEASSFQKYSNCLQRWSVRVLLKPCFYKTNSSDEVPRC